MTDRERLPRVVSVPALIAWLSLCLLAASWGRLFDKRLQDFWSQVGAFGLTAAVGLGGVEQARLLREKWVREKREKAVRLNFDGKLAELSEQSAVLESINDAIRRLVEHAASDRRTQVL